METASAKGPFRAVAVFDNYWAPTLAFAYSLGRRGVSLHFYGRGAGRWSRYCTRSRPCPPVEDTERFLPWLRARIRSGEIERIAPTTDLIAYYCALLREEFPPLVQRSIAPFAEIEAALIKTRFAAACTAIGQQVPRSFSPQQLDEAVGAGRELGYPLIMKPKAHLGVGSDERGCIICDENDLRMRFGPYRFAPGQESIGARYPELRWPLLQRYVPSARQRVFSVSGFKDPQTGLVATALSFKREQWPRHIGTSTSQVSAHDGDLIAAGTRTVDHLLSCGIYELELLADATGPTAIDLNPRAFGFIKLDMARGNDLPWLWFRSTLGAVQPEPPPNPARTIEARHALLYPLRRLAEAFSHDDTGEDSPLRIDRAVSLVGHVSDPLPALLAHARLLHNPRSLIRTNLRTPRSERERIATKRREGIEL